MSVDREELKRMIDQIPEQDAIEVYDFIGYLNMKRERAVLEQLDVASLAEDADLIRQVEESREDCEHGRIYGKEAGLDYLRSKVRKDLTGIYLGDRSFCSGLLFLHSFASPPCQGSKENKLYRIR